MQIDRHEGQGGDVALSLNLPPALKGFRLEQVVKTKIKDPDKPDDPMPPERTTNSQTPTVKNGESTAMVRLTAPATMAPGNYMTLYLKASGMAGSQPYVLNKPLWVTVSGK